MLSFFFFSSLGLHSCSLLLSQLLWNTFSELNLYLIMALTNAILSDKGCFLTILMKCFEVLCKFKIFSFYLSIFQCRNAGMSVASSRSYDAFNPCPHHLWLWVFIRFYFLHYRYSLSIVVWHTDFILKLHDRNHDLTLKSSLNQLVSPDMSSNCSVSLAQCIFYWNFEYTPFYYFLRISYMYAMFFLSLSGPYFYPYSSQIYPSSSRFHILFWLMLFKITHWVPFVLPTWT